MTAPNIVVILADDLGFSDAGAFGGEIETPNLDRLAATGVRMSAFYATPRCSPSRAALLTGRESHSVGIGILTTDDRPHGYAGSLSVDAPTIAERLKARGYATALVGKWHLSSDISAPNETWPTHRGFDEFYGILPGASSYYRPPLYDGERRLDEETTADYYLTDDLSHRAADFVARSAQRGTPFFLYLSYTAPHWPLHAPEADVARYRERYRGGWDRLREERAERLHELGIARLIESAPDPDVARWTDAADPEWESERMAVYAAQVEIMDRGIGTLIAALDAHGVRDDTLIVFCSDNGACAEELPFSERRMNPDICPPFTRDGVEVMVGNEPGIRPGPEAGYSSYGRPWAHLSNAPFRLYKRWVHEGGIASPFIAHWPGGGIAGGEIAHAPAHIVDIVPSILDAVDEPGDGPGVSLLELWRQPGSGDAPAERTLCWEHMGNAAARRGRFKLVRESGRPWGLYDLEADRGETADVAAEHPDVVADLEAAWQRWAEANGVIPWERVLEDFRQRGRAVPQ
ncbi:arylsulfatase [Microbacterium sp. LMI12-1-1.1]|uniref:arylsulfatase n=1 Tax=Microbacterium sp. LMI12-1-1.1 TaxID=3135225 RepID=UPI00341460AB